MSSSEGLLPLARGYLESADFKILEERRDCIVADKLAFGQDRDTFAVWALPPNEEAASYESTFRASISKLRESLPDARACLLAPSRAGFSREFLQNLAEARVRLLVPIQFFDAAFKVEEAPKAASAIADLRALSAAEQRVPQPYKVEPEGEGDDLWETLTAELRRDPNPTVRIIVGRAGIGKSVLFRALFADLYSEFLNEKNRHGIFARPIPLLPDHLKGTYAIRTEALIDSFLRTDVASPVSRETFQWLLVNGFATWMLDGLDELYGGDPNFFDHLADLVTRPGSRARITIWCRDSLLTTSNAFNEFQDLCAGSSMLRVYRLSEWERRSKRHYAWIALEGKPPQRTESRRVEAFLTEIEGAPALRAISGLPFYCTLLVRQFQDGELQSFTDDFAMLSHAIKSMVDREIEKGLLDLRMFEENGLWEWLEQIAVNYVEGRRYADIDQQEAMEYGRLVIRGDVDDKRKNNILTSLLQFPLFTEGEETGRIAFAHDLIAEVLAAGAYARDVVRDPKQVGRRLEKVDLEDPTLLRFVAKKLDADGEKALSQVLSGGLVHDRAFAILLSILMLTRPERDLFKRVRVNFESQNLAGVRFQERDLASISFRRADLSHACFDDCDLADTHLEGAFLNRTRFDGEIRLRGARAGDLTRVESVVVRNKLLEDRARLKEWFAKETGRPEAVEEPCPTALQLRFVFGKFIDPLGLPRRDELKWDALIAGKRYEGAVATARCVEEASRQEYLNGPDYRTRYRRAEGDKYAEMVRYVKDGAVSDGLGGLLAALCPRRGCLHQLGE